MSAAFDREALLDAFDQIGRAAVEAGTKLQIAVYGGSALMLASNFRFATEDVDIADIGRAMARMAFDRCRANSEGKGLVGHLAQRRREISPKPACASGP